MDDNEGGKRTDFKEIERGGGRERERERMY